MNGLGMMLKGFGLDPEAITAAVTDIRALIVEFKAQLDRIENKLDALQEGKPTNVEKSESRQIGGQ